MDKFSEEPSRFDLLYKIELRLRGAVLGGVNLNDVAAAVASVLGLSREEVLVTDAMPGDLCVDILRRDVDARLLAGKKDDLFAKLAAIPGVRLEEGAYICSEGMLGWIALNAAQAGNGLDRAEALAERIQAGIARRAIVFSTGQEVARGEIADTNLPAIAARLETAGYAVTRGPALPDDRDLIAGKLREAVESGGYGLIITTGGVGAEAKDCTIEALCRVDAEAATPYICKFTPGTGRHAKDGVRIGVGCVGETLLVSLPGPNDEVTASLEILVAGVKDGASRRELAERLAENLRRALRSKMKHHGR